VLHGLQRGLDLSFARDAIYRCGAFHGKNKLPRTEDIKEFTEDFFLRIQEKYLKWKQM